MSLNLNSSQEKIIRRVGSQPGYYPAFYPPLKWAVQNGLIERTQANPTDRYELTARGRKVYENMKRIDAELRHPKFK